MKGVLAVATALATLGLALHDAGARADETPAQSDDDTPRLPVGHASRPLTLPRFVLEPHLGFDVAHLDPTLTNLALGASFGVTSDVQVDAIVAPLQLAPTFRYAEGEQPGPRLGITYRAARERSEVGLRLDATFLTLPATTGAIVRAGLPMRFHPGSVTRIDFGVFLPATIGKTTTVGLDMPFAIAFDITDAIHVGATSGFSFPSFGAPTGFTIPFGFLAGYTVASKGSPVVDIDPYIRWPELLPATPPPADTGSLYELGVLVRAYAFL